VSEILDFDPVALREKYRLERDRRLRPDGNDQYVEVAADFRHYIDDPYVEPGFTREPLTDAVDVVIAGGGFGGLLAAARLSSSPLASRWAPLTRGGLGAHVWMAVAGIAKLVLCRDEEAIAWLRRAIEANRNYPMAHLWLAVALAHLGRLTEARAAAQAGLALHPSFTIARFRAGASS
jgi:tetratricopeptide (TPR) repeat protein